MEGSPEDLDYNRVCSSSPARKIASPPLLCPYLLVGFMIVPSFCLFGQEVTDYRIMNITFDTQAPSQLALNRGRIIWTDTDPVSGKHNLKYYSGAEIMKLDSNLLGLTSAIDCDYVVWNESAEQVRLYNLRSWSSGTIGASYYQGSTQQVALANGLLAYTRRGSEGTEIALRRLDSGIDTVFRAGLWNTEPRVSHGQLAWVSAEQESSSASSAIVYYDGLGTRTFSNTPGIRCAGPVLVDGHLAWLELSAVMTRVRVFTGDSIVTLVQAPVGPTRVTGYDLSGGIAVASLTDTVNLTSVIAVFNGENGVVDTIADDAGVSGLHIDNGLVVWQSGVGSSKRLKTFRVASGITEDVSTGENPEVDDEVIAWTNGDAVEMRVPVTYQRLTTGVVSGWAQTRFKTVDSGSAFWGDFTNSTSGRVMAWDGASIARLTDSLFMKDFFMANDGVMIWREDSHTMWSKKGSAPAQKVLDSLQCENMYVANGMIGFHGFRLAEAKAVNQAWTYNTNSGELKQLTTDTSLTIMNGITLVDGDTTCWYRSTPTETMLMLDVKGTRKRLSDSLVGFSFCYRNGRIVWSEQRNGIMQIMMYVPSTATRTQITSGLANCEGPATDGARIAWFEDLPQSQVIVYLDLDSGQRTTVARERNSVFRWLWMSNGRIAWSQDNEIRVFDGNVISRLTNSGDFTPNTEPYVDNERVLWKQDGPDPNAFPRYGDIFVGKLHAHVAFDADRISGKAPLRTSFFNRSWEGAESVLWDFGDGGTSTTPNPDHVYQNSGTYTVTLTVTGLNGVVTESKVRLVHVAPTTAAITSGSTTPAAFVLRQNFPNPFNPSTEIAFEIPTASVVTLKIYDLLGREVATLINKETAPGEHTVRLDASRLASGTYYGRMLAVPTNGKEPSYIGMLKMNHIR